MIDARTIAEAVLFILAAVGGFKAQGFSNPPGTNGRRITMSQEAKEEIKDIWSQVVLQKNCDKEHAHVNKSLEVFAEDLNFIKKGMTELLKR